MKEKIKKHVDSLFSDIYETKQLIELKEEISSNLLEKINDYIAKGDNAEAAFNRAISNLGDMSELVESLKKASNVKVNNDMFKSIPIDKKHVIGYISASVIMLLGLMVGAVVYLQQKDIYMALTYFIPFLIAAIPIYTYFGLTQEMAHDYGMSNKRALMYSVGAGIFLLGAGAAAIEYFQGLGLVTVLFTLMPFIIASAIIFIYLGLTEKSRRKMDSEWEKQWIKYYSDPQYLSARGGISGALWIFSIAAVFFIGFTWGWKYSWIPFVFAVGCEPLIEAIFAAKRKKN